MVNIVCFSQLAVKTCLLQVTSLVSKALIYSQTCDAPSVEMNKGAYLQENKRDRSTQQINWEPQLYRIDLLLSQKA